MRFSKLMKDNVNLTCVYDAKYFKVIGAIDRSDLLELTQASERIVAELAIVGRTALILPFTSPCALLVKPSAPQFPSDHSNFPDTVINDLKQMFVYLKNTLSPSYRRHHHTKNPWLFSSNLCICVDQGTTGQSSPIWHHRKPQPLPESGPLLAVPSTPAERTLNEHSFKTLPSLDRTVPHLTPPTGHCRLAERWPKLPSAPAVVVQNRAAEAPPTSRSKPAASPAGEVMVKEYRRCSPLEAARRPRGDEKVDPVACVLVYPKDRDTEVFEREHEYMIPGKIPTTTRIPNRSGARHTAPSDAYLLFLDAPHEVDEQRLGKRMSTLRPTTRTTKRIRSHSADDEGADDNEGVSVEMGP
ncbi:hypothetical protein EDC01DRAFT_628271 [Geopyxis carbonaria]|nr:hypothetical protein EDC01DRAFT_628271 [Geopyxis carbonaria]